jgi:hypothetical protein
VDVPFSSSRGETIASGILGNLRTHSARRMISQQGSIAARSPLMGSRGLAASRSWWGSSEQRRMVSTIGIPKNLDDVVKLGGWLLPLTLFVPCECTPCCQDLGVPAMGRKLRWQESKALTLSQRQHKVVGVCSRRRAGVTLAATLPLTRSQLSALNVIPVTKTILPSTELLVKEDPGRVIMVWMEYHQDKEGAVGSILSRPEMDTYLFRSKKS